MSRTQAREKAPGQDFDVDVADNRFAAVLEGDSRYGIERTDPGFKVGFAPSSTTTSITLRFISE